jgi:hypothetical protein
LEDAYFPELRIARGTHLAAAFKGGDSRKKTGRHTSSVLVQPSSKSLIHVLGTRSVARDAGDLAI